MRRLAAIRLSASVLCAALVHGVAFGVAALVLSRAPVESPRPPPAVDVDLVTVTPPRPELVADAAPAMVPTKLVASARRHAEAPLVRDVARADSPRLIDPTAPEATPGPSAPPAAPGPPPTGPHRPLSVASAGAVTAAEPRYRSNPKPDYPIPSLRRHEEGVVVLSVTIRADGTVAAASIKRSSGHPLLDRAALDSVQRRWVFDPARVGDVAVSSTRDVPVRFSLSD